MLLFSECPFLAFLAVTQDAINSPSGICQDSRGTPDSSASVARGCTPVGWPAGGSVPAEVAPAGSTANVARGGTPAYTYLSSLRTYPADNNWASVSALAPTTLSISTAGKSRLSLMTSSTIR